MNFDFLQLRSLKTRVTLFTLAIFLIGIWSLAFYVSRMLREDMQRLLGEQQFSTVSIVAAHLNDELKGRMNALELISSAIDAPLLDKPAALQKFVEQHPILQILFNGGIFVTRLDGISIAAVPYEVKRIGVNYMERDFMVAALNEGRATIGRPVVGKVLLVPTFGMAVPIIDARGKVIGALVGATNLGKSSFLNKIAENRYGKTGGYLLVAPQHKLIVTATNKTRIMESYLTDTNPVIDRFDKGFEGSVVFVNPLGVEALQSSKSVPIAGWRLGVQLPTAEAFAPIHDMQQRMIYVALLLTLLSGILTWWMLKRELSPLIDAARTLATMSDSDQPSHSLPIVRQDEIGQLIGGFNHLLETLGQRGKALLVSEERFRMVTEVTNDGIWEWDMLTNQEFFSPRWCEIIGFTVDDPEFPHCFSSWADRIHPDDYEYVMNAKKEHFEKGAAYDVVYRHKHKSGVYRWQNSRGKAIFDENGTPVKMVGYISDITERKQAEDALRQQTEELRASNVELELFNLTATGRELRMIELKQEINELCRRLGEPPRHETDPLETDGVPGAGPAPAAPGGGGV